MDKLNDWVEMAEKADAVANLMDAVNPHDILAIAEAFRALEQRVEAAEEQLAELAKQEPVGTVSIVRDWNTHRNVATVNMRHDLVVSEMKDGDELFTRPAPAAEPVDLVPDEEWFRSHVKSRGMSAMRREGRYVESATRFAHDIWYATQAEMLRRIQGLK